MQLHYVKRNTSKYSLACSTYNQWFGFRHKQAINHTFSKVWGISRKRGVKNIRSRGGAREGNTDPLTSDCYMDVVLLSSQQLWFVHKTGPSTRCLEGGRLLGSHSSLKCHTQLMADGGRETQFLVVKPLKSIKNQCGEDIVSSQTGRICNYNDHTARRGATQAAPQPHSEYQKHCSQRQEKGFQSL